ncbi:MAG TPA: metallophosphoesterase [Opitutus sp.]|nr:metallophosphoesterase [Opitutus sp.]
MTTIAHLSDLHFGTEIPAVVAALAAELQERRPSLVVVSGDLTQRARRSQFRHARAWLDQLPRPQLVVPGNHDVPLYDVVRRFLAPLARYRRFISTDPNPFLLHDEVAVIGLNTARSFTWKSGRISAEQLRLLEQRLNGAGARLKVVVTHHPFLPPPDGIGIDLVGRAALAIPILAAGGADLLLAGHLHRGYSGDVRSHYPASQRAIIAAQAGTATSGRTRHEANAYNWIALSGDRLEFEIRAWSGAGFRPLNTRGYRRYPDGWILDSSPT